MGRGGETGNIYWIKLTSLLLGKAKVADTNKHRQISARYIASEELHAFVAKVKHLGLVKNNRKTIS